DLSNMMPGETRRVAFTFDIEKQLADAEAKVELSISDDDLREVVQEKIRMPIAPAAPLTAASGAAKAKANGAVLQASPDPASPVFGKLPAGAVVQELATSSDWVKVALGPNRFAFARAGDLESASGAPGGAVTFEDAFSHAPPQLDVTAGALA